MNILGLIVSFGFIGMIVGLGFLMTRNKRIKPEFIRKFIHIGVANWWCILLWGFDTLGSALVGPVFFIIANTAAVFTGTADVLGIKDRRRNYGLIYYPISLLLLVVAGFLNVLPMWAAGIGMLTMGYADGFAAVAGQRWGSRRVNGTKGAKTVVGSLVMFAITALVVFGFSVGYHFESLWTFPWLINLVILAAAATLIEAFTPWGVDNLSVPLGTAVIAAWVFGA
jgi:phytol kinase